MNQGYWYCACRQCRRRGKTAAHRGGRRVARQAMRRYLVGGDDWWACYVQAPVG